MHEPKNNDAAEGSPREIIPSTQPGSVSAQEGVGNDGEPEAGPEDEAYAFPEPGVAPESDDPFSFPEPVVGSET